MEGIVHLSPLVIKFGRINFAMDLSPRQAPGHDASITTYSLAFLPVERVLREVPFRLRKEGYSLSLPGPNGQAHLAHRPERPHFGNVYDFERERFGKQTGQIFCAKYCLTSHRIIT